jgi:hypothetical protein
VVRGDSVEISTPNKCDCYSENNDNFPGPGGTQHRLILAEDTQVCVIHGKVALDCIGYIWNNRRRVRYRKFHKQGFCTSSGVVEAGCKVVFDSRLKRAGIHCTVKGANAIIALRWSKLSERLEDFWESRTEQAKAAA